MFTPTLQHGERVNARGGVVGQDKIAHSRDRTTPPRSMKQLTYKMFLRSYVYTMRLHAKRQTVPMMVWVKPSVKEAYQHIATTENISLSQVGATALEESLARRLHIQHAGILQPIIERAIAKHMRAYSSRIVMLLVRSMYASEQTRALTTNILGRRPGVTQPVLEHILDGTSDTAKRNITRVTPQLATLITEIEQWLTQTV